MAGATSAWSPGGIVERLDLPIRLMLDVVGTRALESSRHKLPLGTARPHLERIVDAFLEGYRKALWPGAAGRLPEQLAAMDVRLRGFAFEGAGMATTLLDVMAPGRRRRFAALLTAAPHYAYLLHVGAGWALARTGRPEGRTFGRLDRVLRWLALDGFGFHDHYIRGAADLAAAGRRRTLSRYGARAFDQGVGRSLWFTAGADPSRIAGAVAAAHAERQRDLWSGVGLACAYAGGVGAEGIRALNGACGRFHAHFAQGVAFGAEAHVRAAGLAPPHTEQASQVVCGSAAIRVAQIVRDASEDLPPDADEPAYEVWRSRVRSRMRWPSGQSPGAAHAAV